VAPAFFALSYFPAVGFTQGLAQWFSTEFNIRDATSFLLLLPQLPATSPPLLVSLNQYHDGATHDGRKLLTYGRCYYIKVSSLLLIFILLLCFIIMMLIVIYYYYYFYNC
jgi:hypothetical protein